MSAVEQEPDLINSADVDVVDAYEGPIKGAARNAQHIKRLLDRQV